MIPQASSPDARIDRIVAAGPGRFEPDGIGRWRFAVDDRGELPGRAVLTPGWLWLRVPLQHNAPRAQLTAKHLHDLLAGNAELDAGVKYCLRAGLPPSLHVCAELPLNEDLDLAGRWPHIVAGLAGAAAACRTRRTPAAADDPRQDSADPTPTCLPDSLATLPAACREAGWTVRQRDGGLWFDLDVPGGFEQAVLWVDRAGRVSLGFELPPAEVPLSNASRRATGLLLLEANWVIRMARASARLWNERLVYQWAVVWNEVPAATELQHALAALSIACRLTAGEACALHSERVARAYLRVRAHAA